MGPFVANRYRFPLPFILLIVCLVLPAPIYFSGCSQKKPPSEAGRTGGTLYFGVETAFHGFDVLGTSGFINPSMAPLNNLIQEPLFRMDTSGRLIPVLGLNATPSADGRAWDVQLRRDVYFHDGTPFTADAVIHHWSRLLDPANRYRGRPTFQPIKRVEKIDDHAVRFVLDHPWPPFLNVLTDELLLFNFIPSPSAVEAGIHDKKPVGTGPFRFHRWNAGDHFVVLKNEGYWQPGKPLLNKVVFRSVPDHQTRYASLLAGQLDLITLDRGGLIKKSRDNPELFAFQSEGNGAEIIIMNTTRPPLDDIRVRQALALVNNQNLHIKMVYGDTIPFIRHPFGDGFTCEDDGYLDHDPERARQLIADYGRPVSIECLHTNTSRGRDTGALLQQLYEPIGVALKPVGLSTGPHIMKVINKTYQMATWRIPPSRDHGPQLYRSFHSASPTNFTGYHAAELDRLLDSQRSEADADKRRTIWCDIVRQLNRDVPFLYRGGRRFFIVARKKIKHMMNTPGLTVDLASAWLDEKVKFNLAAHTIEQDAGSAAFDCPDPGDTARVKAAILGAWEGQDDWGASILATFNPDNTVVGGRKGRIGEPRKFVVCGPEVHWRSKSGAKVMVRLTEDEDRLDGRWDYASYTGTFSLAPVKQ